MPDIAIYVPSMAGGGAERVAALLARGFAERGLRCDLVVGRAEGPNLAEVPPDVDVVDLRSRRVVRTLPGLVRYLRRARPGVLLAQPDRAAVVAWLAVALARSETRVFAGVHNTLSHAARNSRLLRDRIRPVLTRHLLVRTEGIVAVSEGSKSDLVLRVGVPPERIQVLHNPVVTDELYERAAEPLDDPWFGPDEPPVVVGVGRLAPQKDFATLIRAFARARRGRPARLVLLGEGPERSTLQRLVAELGLSADVRLAGFAPNPYPYLGRADVLASSSRWEGLPTVLIEALALGTPVVATDCESGPREILEDGRLGSLVGIGDAAALGKAILDALDGDHDREALRRRGRDFTLDATIPAYVRALGLGS